MGSFKNDLKIVTSYSERSIYELIGEKKYNFLRKMFKQQFWSTESFTEVSMTKEIIEEAGICQNCYIKFDEFDQHRSLAEQIQAELMTVFETSSFEEIDVQDVKAESEEIYETSQDDEPDFSVENQESEGGQVILTYDWLPEENLTIKTSRTLPRKMLDLTESESVFIDNEKHYQCDICQRAFKERSKLKAHKEIHTTERNVVCLVRSSAWVIMDEFTEHFLWY